MYKYIYIYKYIDIHTHRIDTTHINSGHTTSKKNIF